MTDWATIIPAGGTITEATMIGELNLYAALLGERGAAPSIASAATTDIDASSAAGAGLVEITGTTGITSFGTTAPLGRRKLVRFAAALTLTHSSSLALPGAANVTTEAGTILLAERVSAGWRVLDVRLPSLMTPGSIDVTGGVQAYLQNNRIIIREERADGTHNGGTTAGSWQARGVTLTETLDAGGRATVSSATFDLVAGTYDVTIRHCFGTASGGVRGRLFNVTDGAAVAESLSETASHGSPATYNTNWFPESRFRMTIAATKTFRLEYLAQVAVATGGLGWHDSVTAGVEIFSVIDALKIA